MTPPCRLLLLAGTTEARGLAGWLAADPGLAITVSLAGRTSQPVPIEGTLRVGGFGGIDGLTHWLVESGTDLVVDATHPYATRIKANAREACRALGLPLLAIDRPAWDRQPGDRWHAVGTFAGALDLIGEAPRCVLVTTGRSSLEALAALPQHLYLIRSVDPPDRPPDLPNAHYIPARGPFSFADEIALMRDYGVEWLIAKNSGGSATYAKIEAARRLGVAVAMIERPPLAQGGAAAVVSSGEAALAWITDWARTRRG